MRLTKRRYNRRRVAPIPLFRRRRWTFRCRSWAVGSRRRQIRRAIPIHAGPSAKNAVKTRRRDGSRRTNWQQVLAKFTIYMLLPSPAGVLSVMITAVWGPQVAGWLDDVG